MASQLGHLPGTPKIRLNAAPETRFSLSPPTDRSNSPGSINISLSTQKASTSPEQIEGMSDGAVQRRSAKVVQDPKTGDTTPRC